MTLPGALSNTLCGLLGTSFRCHLLPLEARLRCHLHQGGHPCPVPPPSFLQQHPPQVAIAEAPPASPTPLHVAGRAGAHPVPSQQRELWPVAWVPVLCHLHGDNPLGREPLHLSATRGPSASSPRRTATALSGETMNSSDTFSSSSSFFFLLVKCYAPMASSIVDTL